MSWFVLVLAAAAASCSGKSKRTEVDTTPKKLASNQPVNDPPWLIADENSPDIVIHDEPVKKQPTVKAAAADAGVATVAKDAGLDGAVKVALVADAAVKPDCVSLCEEARTCIQRFVNQAVDCAKECGESKPADVDRALKCRAEIAKGCDAWMKCLLDAGG